MNEENQTQNETEASEVQRLAESGTDAECMAFLACESEDVEADAKTLDISPCDFDGERVHTRASCEFRDWLQENEYVIDAHGVVRSIDDVVWIDGLDEYYPADECVEVRTRRNNTVWRLEGSDDIFWCEETREWYDSDHYHEITIDGRSYCQEEVEAYYWESDDSWHWEAEPEEDEMGLTDYQRGHRSGVVPGRAVSLEIELVVGEPDSSFGDRIRSICDACERDGSLPENGAEIIVGSTLVTELPGKLTQLCSIFSEYDCAGHVEGKEGIGIHVSVSRREWGIDNSTLAHILILFAESKEFFEAIAQRKETHWARYFSGKPTDAARKIKRGPVEKYEAVAIRTWDRLEFRLFRSSCRKERILKNVETVVACVDFCKAKINFRDVNLSNFRAFLKENAKNYQNLVNFIQEKGI